MLECLDVKLMSSKADNVKGMVLMFLAWTITSSIYERTQDVKTSGYPQVVFVWCFNVFYALAWSGLLVAYALEILPFRLRAKGLMIMNLTVQAALVLSKYVTDYSSLFPLLPRAGLTCVKQLHEPDCLGESTSSLEPLPLLHGMSS